MAKIAKLVRVSFTTRVVVEDTASVDEIIEVARPRFKKQMDLELYENLEEIVVDTECPYDETIELTEEEIKVLEKRK
jgi:hypothetical protein